MNNINKILYNFFYEVDSDHGTSKKPLEIVIKKH